MFEALYLSVSFVSEQVGRKHKKAVKHSFEASRLPPGFFKCYKTWHWVSSWPLLSQGHGIRGNYVIRVSSV